jgi:hypothetical protein
LDESIVGILRYLEEHFRISKSDIEKLDDRILLKILGYLGVGWNGGGQNQELQETSSDSESSFDGDLDSGFEDILFPNYNVSNLTSVCQRWRDLIEHHHLFSSTNFFQEPRSESDYELLLKSNRKFKALTFMNQIDSERQLEFLGRFLLNQVFLEEAEITVFEFKTSSDQYFTDLLDVFRNFRKITLNVSSGYQPKDGFDPIEFWNLRELILKGFDGPDCDLSNYLITPNLEVLKIFFTCAPFYHKWEDVLPFVNQICQSSINEIEIANDSDYSVDFLWTREKLFVRKIEDPKNQLKIFLANRMVALKQITILGSKNKRFNDFIVERAGNSVHFKCDLRFADSLKDKFVLKKFAMLDIDGFGSAGDYFAKLGRKMQIGS